jgi:hypothetical protein
VNGRRNVSLVRKPSVLEAGGSSTLVLCEIELPSERNTAYLLGFSSVKNITIVQNSSIQVSGISLVDLGRKPSMLEARESSTLILYENYVNFERNTVYLSVFQV